MERQDEIDEVVGEFLVECHENLDRLDGDLLVLERGQATNDTLASIFRTIHTIKGTCGFLGLGKLESVAHKGENLLSLLRDGKVSSSPELTGALLRLVDAIRAILSHIEHDGGEGDDDYRMLLSDLEELARTDVSATPTESEAVLDDFAPEPSVDPGVAAPGSSEPTAPELADAAPASGDPRVGSSVADRSVRLDTGVLDRLMDLVSELVAARNQILQFSTKSEDPSFLATSHNLNLITTELQEGVMKTRMQPIANLWGKYPRIVRDLALSCGRQIRLEMEGSETELDRTILEAIKDPLTHVLRNAADHGIESPTERIAAGKPAEGVLRLRAFHEGGQINIEISDDGKGIDCERVLARAIERGLVSRDNAARMSEHEITRLIFLPGFSTAQAVTNVSGRGVGMDVVRTNIEQIGGSVDVQSRFGHGTVLRIKIPLTLAIIPALIVRVGDERYAIPQVSLLELVRIEGDRSQLCIEQVMGQPVFRLRGDLLPLARLRHEVGIRHESQEGDGSATSIVVLQAENRQFGVIVDEILDTQEIVVKPLGKRLGALSLFAGATILGDGKVALILDVLGLANRASMLQTAGDRASDSAVGGSAGDRKDAEAQTLLLFGLADGARMAMPLSMVARLEEFPLGRIERADTRRVVQYRGEILPLIDVSSALGSYGGGEVDGSEREHVHVIVYSEGGRSVGLLVDRILDVVEQRIELSTRVARPSVLGSAVIQGAVTEILDVRGIILNGDPLFDIQEAA
ncbi:MAG: chemotaxis protein CheW [Deltaproteobacteria bacterium]|nr:chemotaxis protein CheW [Nannocystaceae bacterium]